MEKVLLPQPPFETAVDPVVQAWVIGLVVKAVAIPVAAQQAAAKNEAALV